ncbi:hypothetical protein OS190_18910 [Sulfitobacter sp. F26204]|uniref:hypothetical protein n=1 Tax=Sulfitobacter sp. F26204 TaxID=2996014 RepID=UPI00225DCD99|nr:hypothetical protein [Sulfitobacter sp. F26204]MCX7561638.1 hypothetical protein [Sulfitobacter sp. F26204]
MPDNSLVMAELVSMGMGLKIPSTSLAANLINGFYLKITSGGQTTVYGVAATLGFDQGGLVVYGIATDPFGVKFDYSKGVTPHTLENKLVDLSIDAGIVIAKLGKIDIKLTIYDENNAPMMSVERVDVEAQGIMIADAKVRGRLVNLSKGAPAN